MWDDHPSVWQYSVCYFTVLMALIFGHFIQVALYPYPFHAISVISFGMTLANVGLYWKILLIYLIFGIMIVALFVVAYYVLKSFRTRYAVVDDQLIVRHFSFTGIREDRTELYRIVDFSMTQSVLGVFCGFSNIKLLTTDRARQVIVLLAVRKGPKFLDVLRSETERCREAKGVREYTSGIAGVGDQK